MEKQTAVRETLLKEFANCSDKLFINIIPKTFQLTLFMFCQPPFAQPYLTPKENEFDKITCCIPTIRG